MTLIFQLLCNFGKRVKLFNCQEMLKLCIKSVLFLFLMAVFLLYASCQNPAQSSFLKCGNSPIVSVLNGRSSWRKQLLLWKLMHFSGWTVPGSAHNTLGGNSCVMFIVQCWHICCNVMYDKEHYSAWNFLYLQQSCILAQYLAFGATLLIHYKGMYSSLLIPNIFTKASVTKLTRDALSSKHLYLCKHPLTSCTFKVAMNIISVKNAFRNLYRSDIWSKWTCLCPTASCGMSHHACDLWRYNASCYIFNSFPINMF
jgi:hypothetical protein